MKRRIGFLLSIFFIFSSFVVVWADDLQDQINKKNAELQQSNGNKNTYDNKISEISEDKKETQEQIDSLDNNINNLQKELDNLKKQSEITSGEINNINARIDKTIKEIKDKEVLLDKRLVMLYKNGNFGYLNVILNSRSFSDLVQRYIYVDRVLRTDRELISTIKKSKKELEENKLSLEKKKAQLNETTKEKDMKYANIQDEINEKNKIMKKLEEDANQYKKMLDKEEADANKIQKEINQLIASQIEARKKAQEEKKKQEKSKPKSSGGIASNGKLSCVTGSSYPITSIFGMRYHPVLKINRMHYGIDIGVPFGTPIYALKDGTVISSTTMSGYGNVVMIDHGDIVSVYAHNSSLSVTEGQAVKGGEKIAVSGNSGVSSGPHLHFEIRNAQGTAIDPTSYYIK